jgi:hypothetical protein
VNITVEREEENELNAERWAFYFYVDIGRLAFRLSNYSHLSRATKRHKFEVVKMWDAYSRRESTLNREDVEVPIWIILDAKDQIKAKIDALDLI